MTYRIILAEMKNAKIEKSVLLETTDPREAAKAEDMYRKMYKEGDGALADVYQVSFKQKRKGV